MPRLEDRLPRLATAAGKAPVFLSLATDLKERAAAIEGRMDGATAGPLAGLMVAVKDNIAVADLPLSCGSRILEGYISPYSATAVERLQAADGLLVGKTNLDEFAMGSSGEYSAFGAVPNPHDPGRVAGGSSSGSAAAVAADLVDLALGSDTGGSVRLPAAFCGVIGLKPTYGRISRYGLVSFAPSLDSIGIIAQKVADCARLLTVIAGADPADASSMAVELPDYRAALEQDTIKGLRIGLPREYFDTLEEPEIRKVHQDVIQFFSAHGVACVPVSLPLTPQAVPCYYILAMAEASSNLARFDGMRYGRRQVSVELLESYVRTRSTGFGAEAKRRIILGTFILSRKSYDRYYGQALRVRRCIRREYLDLFSEVDLLYAPTTAEAAFPLGERAQDPLKMYAADLLTLPANLAGLPALQIPVGANRAGLPLGGQLIGRDFAEETILRLGHYIERHFLKGEA